MVLSSVSLRLTDFLGPENLSSGDDGGLAAVAGTKYESWNSQASLTSLKGPTVRNILLCGSAFSWTHCKDQVCELIKTFLGASSVLGRSSGFVSLSFCGVCVCVLTLTCCSIALYLYFETGVSC